MQTTHWHADIVGQLAVLGDRYSPSLAEVFASHNELARQSKRITQRNLELERQLAILRMEHADLIRSSTAAGDFSSPNVQKRIQELEQQLSEIKDERAELYKTQGQNAQRLLELMDITKKQEESMKVLNEENKRIIAANSSLTTKANDLQDNLREKDNVIQILRDELQAYQLELSQREEQLKTAQETVKKLEVDNKELVERLVSQKEDTAKKMNEANEYIENALKTRKSVGSPVSDALQPPGPTVGPSQSSVPGNIRATATAAGFFSSMLRRVSGDVPQTDARYREVPLVQSLLPISAVKVVSAHESEINCMQVTPDGSMIASGGGDKKIMLMDAKTGVQRGQFTGSLAGVMCVAFNNTGDLILGTSNDNSTKIWSIATGRPKHTLTGHIGKVYSAKFTESNKIFSGSYDRTIKHWDLAKGYCIKTIFTLSSCNDLALLDPEGNLLASGHIDNNLRIWDTRSGNLVRELAGIHGGQITSVEVVPNSNHVLTTSRDNMLRLIDLRTYETVQAYASEGFKVGLNWARSCISPDGAYIASGSIDGAVFIWNFNTTKLETTLKAHTSAICSTVWNPRGGAALYSADKDKNIVFWGI
ncbi:WD40-repeat-containing domain protein [Polychytrium aggregatum]|uniref:WD40-repeat-containing domain protein n=1 Tax=Polychytrium aggregatum TaxID=110093 RepID=UPI0022FECA6E|nr:WD40-repeat-containing domain protein [Polychytrium aggregatum]KAI9209131.1 WD40-repeat-containing domain protein [Polychytrium aggregatum]